jgi:hypothetical protein
MVKPNAWVQVENLLSDEFAFIVVSLGNPKTNAGAGQAAQQ